MEFEGFRSFGFFRDRFEEKSMFFEMFLWKVRFVNKFYLVVGVLFCFLVFWRILIIYDRY